MTKTLQGLLSNIKNILKIFCFLGLGVIIAGVFSALYLQRWGTQLRSPYSDTGVLYFPKGTKLISLAGRLESLGVVDSALKYYFWAKLNVDYNKFQAGNYQFREATSPLLLTEKIIKGEVYHPIQLEFNIPEGFSLAKVLNRLEALRVAKRDELIRLAFDPDFLRDVGVAAASLEGYIYPATYTFYKRPRAKDVFKEFVSKFNAMVDVPTRGLLAQKGLSLHQAVIFASLIEKETLHDDERSKIAEVIWNRLGRNEPLGIDAATIYGIEDFSGDLRWAHLKDKENPYNTRVHRGLPPGPITSPSIASLKAILNPTDKGYYYYVLIADGQKRHHFSSSLEEHNAHVRKLVKQTSLR